MRESKSKEQPVRSRFIFQRVSGGSLVALVFVFFASGVACHTQVFDPNATNGTNASTVRTVSYAQDVQPILTMACAGCHSPGGAADLQLIPMYLREGESYAAIVNQPSVQLDDVVLVVPGDSASSLLYVKVSSDDPPIGMRMPRYAPVLTEDEIALIREWIDQGALDN